jgi:hypothetical protein
MTLFEAAALLLAESLIHMLNESLALLANMSNRFEADRI